MDRGVSINHSIKPTISTCGKGHPCPNGYRCNYKTGFCEVCAVVGQYCSRDTSCCLGACVKGACAKCKPKGHRCAYTYDANGKPVQSDNCCSGKCKIIPLEVNNGGWLSISPVPLATPSKCL